MPSFASLTTDEALERVAEGYCLWIGAGLGMHLGYAAGAPVPGWLQVVENLEGVAGITDHLDRLRYPERLERCLRGLRRPEFQRHLRRNVVRPLAEAVLKMAALHASQRACLPVSVRQLAHLGSLANPIVNFNVETMTSRLVADPSGSSKVHCFRPPVPGGTTLLGGGHGFTARARRSVYHPHGAVDDSGICVMTESEYGSLNGTLGLQLAVHSAFEEDLVIVGMSLEDKYLREQLRLFRPQIGEIYWFVDDLAKVPPDAIDWAAANDVEIVIQPWPTFWERVTALLPGPAQEVRLVSAWLITVEVAAHECLGRPHTWRDLALRLKYDSKGAYTPAAVDELRWLARIRGEEGDENMTDDEISKLPTAAMGSVEAIRRARVDAERTDAFCRIVAETDGVFIQREKTSTASAMDGALAARDFWSTQERAQIAINLTHKADRDRFFPAPVLWRSVAERWRRAAAPTDLIRVDERGYIDRLDVPADRIARQIEAIRSW